ncbi:uncharacterized protein LOC133914882 [Phragmites australis]|uniref:uncharacterized protein LOC133914882 n=1 Tax=Phragmites australis TaxID=29695 RepID=UPI002D773D55|nr:uncharacterized protein LOC133914882 [Phragmites australis]
MADHVACIFSSERRLQIGLMKKNALSLESRDLALPVAVNDEASLLLPEDGNRQDHECGRGGRLLLWRDGCGHRGWRGEAAVRAADAERDERLEAPVSEGASAELPVRAAEEVLDVDLHAHLRAHESRHPHGMNLKMLLPCYVLMTCMWIRLRSRM